MAYRIVYIYIYIYTNVFIIKEALQLPSPLGASCLVLADGLAPLRVLASCFVLAGQLRGARFQIMAGKSRVARLVDSDSDDTGNVLPAPRVLSRTGSAADAPSVLPVLVQPPAIGLPWHEFVLHALKYIRAALGEQLQPYEVYSGASGMVAERPTFEAD